MPAPPPQRKQYSTHNLEIALNNAKTAFGRNTRIPTATDGSSIDQQVAAGCGVAIGATNNLSAYSEGWELVGSDTTNWAGELDAVDILLTAAYNTNTRIHTWIDNKSVKDHLEHLCAGRARTPRYGFMRWHNIQQIITEVPNIITCEWVPSHNKKDEWRPSGACGLSAGAVRALNELADIQAGQHAQKSFTSRRIGAYKYRLNNAQLWSRLTLERLVETQKTWLNNSGFHDLVEKWHTVPQQNNDDDN
jgi:ribonuclease HI